MMKKQFEQSLRLWHKHGRLFLVVLATLLLVGLLPHWVNAASATTGATFNSPLPKPTHEGDELRDLLRTIIDRDALTAEVLGISVEDLQAARESGVRLDELVTKLGLDEATVHQALQTAFTQAVEQAVADGKLTQEQANLVLTPPAQRGDEGHQHGPGQGPGDRQPGAPEANTTPEPTSATPRATASATNGNATAAASPSAPERHPHDRRDNPNAQGNQTNNASSSNTTGSSATGSNATTLNNTAANPNAASTPQAGNGENGGPRNRANGNHHGR